MQSQTQLKRWLMKRLTLLLKKYFHHDFEEAKEIMLA